MIPPQSPPVREEEKERMTGKEAVRSEVTDLQKVEKGRRSESEERLKKGGKRPY